MGQSPSHRPVGLHPFRFQGAWFDATTSLNWVITRWYAQSLGRFISEDTLLGTPADPPSRHLYAYAAGEPIGRWDPDGRATAWPAWTTTKYSAEPSSRVRGIRNPKKATGYVTLGLFIAAPKSYVKALGILPAATLDGDSRGFSASSVDCIRARACIKVNFDRKYVSATLNPTCGHFPAFFPFSCNSQFPMRDYGVSYTEKYNVFRVTEGTDGKITVKWDFTQTMMPIVRPSLTINGTLEIWPGPTKSKYRYQGDLFPSQEMYYFVGSTRQKLVRINESGYAGMGTLGSARTGYMYRYFA